MQVRLCPEHALQLNHRKNQEAMRAQRKALRKQERRRGGEDAGSHADEAAADGRKRRRADPQGTHAPLLEPACLTRAWPCRLWVNVCASRGHAHLAGDEQEQEEAGQAGEEEDSDEGAAKPEGEAAEEANIWKGKAPALEASRDEEMDEYFSGMFL